MKGEKMYCPFVKDECRKNCALWSVDFESCSITLIGEGMKEISFAADDVNLDCGIRIHVTSELVDGIDER